MAKKKRKTKTVTSRVLKHDKNHPDHSKQLPKLNRVEGQLAGIKKMIEEQRYCPDIIQQVRASRKALYGIEAALLEAHLNHCVTNAIKSSDNEKEEKFHEIMQIFKSAQSQGIEF